MSESENVNTVNHSTQTYKNISDKTRIDLLTLANMFLHASYWFLTLSSSSTNLNLPGFAWATKEKEKKCKDAALMIMNLIHERGESLDLADIAKPRYQESELSSTFIAKRWNDVEDWIENKIKEINDSLEPKDKEATGKFLDSLLHLLKSVS